MSAIQIVKHNPQVDRAMAILQKQIAKGLWQAPTSFQEVEVNVRCDWNSGKFTVTIAYEEYEKFDLTTWDSLPSRVVINFSEEEILKTAEAITTYVKPDLIKVLNSKRPSGISGMVLFIKQGRLTGITMEESRRAPASSQAPNTTA